MIKFLSIQIVIALVASCRGKTDSKVGERGADKTTKDKVLNTGANLLQQKSTINAITAYLNGFHFYNGNMEAQMEAHHYVTQLSNDLYQAIIYDVNKKDAKIMGVAYIVPEEFFT